MLFSFMAFMLVFSIIVLVHEFGHFIAARKSGVSVYEFSIGFPFSPRLFTLFRHKETEFTVRLLPLGGFVNFSKDGDEESIELFDAPHSKRALILSAGSLCNIAFAFMLFIPIFMIGKHLPFADAILLSAKTVWTILSGTVMALWNIFFGGASMEGLSGPVGIAAMAGREAGKGLLNLFYFTGVMSMSLGILNLFPFPALDGGQLLMLAIESVRKKPLGVRTYQTFNLIGFSLFVILTVIVTYKDIIRLIA